MSLDVATESSIVPELLNLLADDTTTGERTQTTPAHPVPNTANGVHYDTTTAGGSLHSSESNRTVPHASDSVSSYYPNTSTANGDLTSNPDIDDLFISSNGDYSLPSIQTPYSDNYYPTPNSANHHLTPNSAHYPTPNSANQYVTPNSAHHHPTSNSANQYFTPNSADQYLAPNSARYYPTPNGANQHFTPNPTSPIDTDILDELVAMLEDNNKTGHS